MPEYNFSFPGVFKIALDWFTKPPIDNVLYNNIAGIVSAPIGMIGGSIAQYQLWQVLFLRWMFYPSHKYLYILQIRNSTLKENYRKNFNQANKSFHS